MEAAKRLAVLIDADNVPASIADPLFEEIAGLGEASIRRIYGDFSSSRTKNWQDVLNRHAINAVQQFNYTTGKNAADIALVIDAMDLLHGGRVDGFCLVSSDSDFTRLASRIREQGLTAFGIGANKTPKAFINACNRFIYIENLGGPVAAPFDDSVAGSKEAVRVSARQTAADAAPLILKAMEQMNQEDGWYHLGALGAVLGKLYPDFDPRTYGCQKLSELVRKAGGFKERQTSGAIEIARK
jgi:hypothetical protein